jgi:hypothetical protein
MRNALWDHTRVVATDHFSGWIAQNYEALWPHLFDPAVDFLCDIADDGPVVEFGIGTGRLALPMSRRGITEYREKRPLGPERPGREGAGYERHVSPH